MPNLHVERARSEMAGALTAIAWEAKKHWGYPDAWMQAWREELTISPSMILDEETWVASVGGVEAGFYVLMSRDDTKGILEHLWVLPAFMGRGIGTDLFRHALDRARSLNLKSVAVTADPNAEAFYLKMGGKRTGTTVGSVCGTRRELPLLTISLA